MKLPTELLFLTTLLLPPISSAPATPPLHRRTASFASVLGLTPLNNDFSDLETVSHPTKFFHESTFSYHYDGRFASSGLPHEERLEHLRLMLRAYTSTMARIGVRTWLMHGCLLGWWWNGRIMPWDTDMDFMVDEIGMRELGGWWNMSVHDFPDHKHEDSNTNPREKDGGRRKYLLEINPQYTNTSTTDRDNVIDARWIDTATGLFIDITTLHTQPPSEDEDDEEEAEDKDPGLYTKDKHAYSQSQIFPLRTSTFEDLPISVPYGYEEVLLDEYGPKAITERWYRGWKFVGGEWLRDQGEATEEFEQWGKGKVSEEKYMIEAIGGKLGR
jgi:phosphorylcholine metabolism protein LicD